MVRRSALVCATGLPLETPQFIAFVGSRLAVDPLIDALFDGVLQDGRPGADDTFRSDAHAVTEGRVHADETVIADNHLARDHGMAGDKAVVADDGVVPDVIAAPDHDVVAYLHEWLNDVVLKDEAIVAHLDMVPMDGLAVDVANQGIALALA